MIIILLGAVLIWWTINTLQALKEAETAPERPPVVKDPEPIQEPPKIDRVKLERIAQNVLSTYGVKFDTYYYVRNKSDIELMDIITRYNLDD